MKKNCYAAVLPVQFHSVNLAFFTRSYVREWSKTAGAYERWQMNPEDLKSIILRSPSKNPCGPKTLAFSLDLSFSLFAQINI
jgi:hypothetical protein